MEYLGDIFYHLEHTIELKPEYRQKMKTDTDLDLIKRSYSFYKLLGYDHENEDDIRTMLTEIDWYGPKPGVYPPGELGFSKDGKVSFLELRFTDDGSFTFASFNGSYTLSENEIHIQLSESLYDKTEFRAVFREGVIRIPELSTDYTDDDDPCSA